MTIKGQIRHSSWKNSHYCKEININVILTRGSLINNVRKAQLQEVRVERASTAELILQTTKLVIVWYQAGHSASEEGALLLLQPMPSLSAGFFQTLIIGQEKSSCKTRSSETSEVDKTLLFYLSWWPFH